MIQTFQIKELWNDERGNNLFFLNLRQQDLLRDEQFKTLANKHLETRQLIIYKYYIIVWSDVVFIRHCFI